MELRGLVWFGMTFAVVFVSPEQWEAALAGLQAWGRQTSPADHISY